jgi:hypothetical protein
MNDIMSYIQSDIVSKAVMSQMTGDRGNGRDQNSSFRVINVHPIKSLHFYNAK